MHATFIDMDIISDNHIPHILRRVNVKRISQYNRSFSTHTIGPPNTFGM